MKPAGTIIAVRHYTGSDLPCEIYVNGTRSFTDTLQLRSHQDVPITGVWLNSQRVYDVEVWFDGHLKAKVPARSGDVDRSFETLEQFCF